MSAGLLIRMRRHAALLLLVLLPVAGTAVYQGFIASDVFVSESKFIVRSPTQGEKAGLLGVVLQGSGLTRAQDDSYAVQQFVLSRDALAELQQRFDMRSIYGGDGIDRLSRFPRPFADSGDEALYRYYLGRVSVEFDAVSSLTTLKVQGFTPEDAQRISRALLEMGERLVNEMNSRAQANAVREAEAEVEDARIEVDAAVAAVREFRNRQLVLDPQRQSVQKLEEIASIRALLVETRAQLAQLLATAPDSPQIEGLRRRERALQQQIDQEFRAAAGASNSFANIAGEYEQLMLNQQLAAERLSAAKQLLSGARAEARRQTLYVDRVVAPSLPDEAEFPRPLRSTLVVLLSALVGYGLLRLLVASIREHQA